jgi:hypothetical protein
MNNSSKQKTKESHRPGVPNLGDSIDVWGDK